MYSLNNYKDALLNPSENYIKDITDYHYDKYGQVYNKDFNIDELDTLNDKQKKELKEQSFISTSQYPSHYDSMDTLNYKKALLDTTRIQSIEDKHFNKLNQLLD